MQYKNTEKALAIHIKHTYVIVHYTMADTIGSIISLHHTDSQERSNDSKKESSLTTQAPDGGWGWVIVASTFLLYFLLGFSFSGFSILYVEWVDYFDCDRGKAAWIGSIYVASGNTFSKYLV